MRAHTQHFLQSMCFVGRILSTFCTVSALFARFLHFLQSIIITTLITTMSLKLSLNKDNVFFKNVVGCGSFKLLNQEYRLNPIQTNKKAQTLLFSKHI